MPRSPESNLPDLPDSPDNSETFYRRYLPHWEKPGAAYFITFRVTGSLPHELQLKARLEIKSIEQRLSLQNRSMSDYEKECLAVYEKYLDADQTNPILKSSALAGLVRDALLFHHLKKYHLLAWCIMPNHVHILLIPQLKGGANLPENRSAALRGGEISPRNQYDALAEIMHSLKSFTAHEAQKGGLIQGSLWQREYFDRWIRNSDELEEYRRYIRQNPVLAGLVKQPEDYRWLGEFNESAATEGGAP